MALLKKAGQLTLFLQEASKIVDVKRDDCVSLQMVSIDCEKAVVRSDSGGKVDFAIDPNLDSEITLTIKAPNKLINEIHKVLGELAVSNQ